MVHQVTLNAISHEDLIIVIGIYPSGEVQMY